MAEQPATFRAQTPLGAQISHMLKARGVETIFGIPGVHNQEMYRGIEEAGITHVLARHEQGAGFMADGYARATGKPGVAYVITGPGLCNIMTPMGQAYSDSVPVLVLSSCLDDVAARTGQLHQMLDQCGAAACVCDWSHEARDARSAYHLVDRALAEFASTRARPKHIQVPISALEGGASAAPDARPLAVAPAVAEQVVDRVAEALNGAQKPLVILGGGAVRATDAWRQVVARLGAATFTTYAGRGIMGAEAPLDFGTYLARPESASVIAEADLVLAVGTELSENDLWRDELGHAAPLIRVDIDAAQLGGAPNCDTPVLADARALADALLMRELRHTNGWRAGDVAAARARWRAESDAERPGVAPLCEVLRGALPEDTMIYSDMTQFAYVANEVWPMAHPGHWHHPSGFGTLGYALPAAIGGAVARRGKPTIAIAGDYGFQYTVQELGTAVELGLSLPILLWDNGKLKEIEDSMVRAQIAPNAVIAHNPDFCALARAYGAYAEAPQTHRALQDAVRAALVADRPTLIHMTSALGAG
ncbi:acetolactate synthase-1/2/3 large subunit/5-guanidino-2-oxopentanoate decarboxylase [Roseovarius marisflavi]|uniref:Acetolactate synthase-1/2/3 large subunit/5-guanidino-2-oxopentanoate decarboxylase n=1 Tax=Roseovarius marisflavi TaxID=1054996 RepID=A0A1M6YNC8_9RHOB|nr:5-guanidino-2-oxopentanoate decarboxylase [Roseovarius marisflavi]SHL19717.1 acetolactate synthase-1/2/3 large subunit/5-guanidino-2-oxopentanoate decarboxylase [Roseovarius marisflavi]